MTRPAARQAWEPDSCQRCLNRSPRGSVPACPRASAGSSPGAQQAGLLRTSRKRQPRFLPLSLSLSPVFAHHLPPSASARTTFSTPSTPATLLAKASPSVPLRDATTAQMGFGRCFWAHTTAAFAAASRSPVPCASTTHSVPFNLLKQFSQTPRPRHEACESSHVSLRSPQRERERERERAELVPASERKAKEAGQGCVLGSSGRRGPGIP